MSRDNLNVETIATPIQSDEERYVEKKWQKLTEINDFRNNFAESFELIMEKLLRIYQPVCLKEYFEFKNKKNFLKLVCDLDESLNKMECLLSEQKDEWKSHFTSQMIYVEKLKIDAEGFLKQLGSYKSNNDGVYYFLCSESYARQIASLVTNSNSACRERLAEQLKITLATVDEYRLYFNSFAVVPQSQVISTFMRQIESGSSPDGELDAGRLTILQSELQQKVDALKEGIQIAKLKCDKALSELHIAMSTFSAPGTAGLFSNGSTAAQSVDVRDKPQEKMSAGKVVHVDSKGNSFDQYF